MKFSPPPGAGDSSPVPSSWNHKPETWGGEVEGAGVETGCAALLAKAGGIGPKIGGSRIDRDGFKLGVDPFLLLRGGVAKHLKSDGFAKAGKRNEVRLSAELITFDADYLAIARASRLRVHHLSRNLP